MEQDLLSDAEKEEQQQQQQQQKQEQENSTIDNTTTTTTTADDNNGTPVTPATALPPATTARQRDAESPRNRPTSDANATRPPRAPPSYADVEDQLSPQATDRVFPIRSVVSVDNIPTPYPRGDRLDSYFQTSSSSQTRRMSLNTNPDSTPSNATPVRGRHVSADRRPSPSSTTTSESIAGSRYTSISTTEDFHPSQTIRPHRPSNSGLIDEMVTDTGSIASDGTGPRSERLASQRAHSTMSAKSAKSDTTDTEPLVTARFKHVVSEGGHAIITGRDGDTLQRCEDEPIHIPGAVQAFGLLIAFEEQQEGKLVVRMVSENSTQLLGYTPRQLFALDSLTDILSDEQADNLLDHVDFIRDEDADVVANGPEVFTLTMRTPQRRSRKFWCAMHVNERNPNLVICEFELEDDPVNPLVPPNDATPEPPEDTLDSNPTEEEFLESTQNSSKPLRVLRSARKRKGEAAAMEVFNIMSQVQEQLAAAPNLDRFLKILVGVVKELTGFHRVMIYQFDQNFNGRVITELVDPRATKDLYKGLNFPASDIPKQARDLYKINKVRMLYDRDHETARLVCRTLDDLEIPLDLTYSYLRAMSPIHIKYLRNMAVRSSMSISINAFDELWGLIACHSYGGRGMRVSFPIRKMCRLVGDSASRNIERLSYASRLQARKLINTVPTQSNPSGYIIASSEDLLQLFDADFGLLSIRDETKILGNLEQSQEALAMLEYLRMRSITSVITSQDIKQDFPDLRYPPGFSEIAGLLLVPLSSGGQDFIVFFRKGQLREVKWAGNPYEKFIKAGTEGYLEPRKSFKTWSETIVGKCRDWTEEETETAAVLCLVYGKFIEVWRQKEAALQNSQLTRLLLANSAHEVRTPLNAIINYLEIALEGSLDQETRDNLAKSHSASKSLIYVINDLLDLTKTEEGGELVKDEIFDLSATLLEATDMFAGDARRKGLSYEVIDRLDLPKQVVGDQRRVRQAISNITANAIQNTTEGGVRVEMYSASRDDSRVEVEVSVSDTGVGMSSKKLDALFRELEQVESETQNMLSDTRSPTEGLPEFKGPKENQTLGLGLAVVARIIRNMNGQLRLKSEEGKGSRFILQIPFDIPDNESKQRNLEAGDSPGSVTVTADHSPDMETPPLQGMMTLIERGSGKRRTSASHRDTVSRQPSSDSVASRKSLAGSARSARSVLSKSSNRSSKSEADRLIEAIQEPYRVEGWHEHGLQRATSAAGGTPDKLKLEKRYTDSEGSPTKQMSRTEHVESVPQYLRETKVPHPGEIAVMDQGQPIRAVRMPDDVESDLSTISDRPRTLSAPSSSTGNNDDTPQAVAQASDVGGNALAMKVLVAEDDPVNSRIIKKRLERLGHDVHLTVNGEECSSTYCENTGSFDVILMDMQMPIVDGMTSTTMIRSFEKTQPTQILSVRASMHGRIPIIAVSASLIERNRGQYVDAGFDGWILKPISFVRLQEIMEGIIDAQVRRENLYTPGSWERGGWFNDAQRDLYAANTTPAQQPPQTAPSQRVKIAAASDDPHVKEEDDSEQSREQQRPIAGQER